MAHFAVGHARWARFMARLQADDIDRTGHTQLLLDRAQTEGMLGHEVGRFASTARSNLTNASTLSDTTLVNSAPTDMDLSANIAEENSVNGTVVGVLSAIDPDIGDVLTFSLLDDAGGRFAISGNEVVVAGPLDYETATSHSITVRVTDLGGETYDEAFNIFVNNLFGVGITGSAGNDLIDATHTVTGQPFPTNEDDLIVGLAGMDTISALAGNDLIHGGPGADTMMGGPGSDSYIVDHASDVVTENPNEGTDGVSSLVSFTLGPNIESLNLFGTAISGTGNAEANFITGNSLNNILAGLGGADMLNGGAGNDIASYAASPAGVAVSLVSGIGLGGDAQGDELANMEGLIGSSFADALFGNPQANTLIGGAGADVLFGDDANDMLNGGAGNDILAGGREADNMTGGAGADQFLFLDVMTPIDGLDSILDFNRLQGDRINLAPIDADPNMAGDQAFTFIGSGAFTGQPGELGYTPIAGGVRVRGDVDGDGFENFKLDVMGPAQLFMTDFIL